LYKQVEIYESLKARYLALQAQCTGRSRVAKKTIRKEISAEKLLKIIATSLDVDLTLAAIQIGRATGKIRTEQILAALKQRPRTFRKKLQPLLEELFREHERELLMCSQAIIPGEILTKEDLFALPRRLLSSLFYSPVRITHHDPLHYCDRVTTGRLKSNNGTRLIFHGRQVPILVHNIISLQTMDSDQAFGSAPTEEPNIKEEYLSPPWQRPNIESPTLDEQTKINFAATGFRLGNLLSHLPQLAEGFPARKYTLSLALALICSFKEAEIEFPLPWVEESDRNDFLTAILLNNYQGKIYGYIIHPPSNTTLDAFHSKGNTCLSERQETTFTGKELITALSLCLENMPPFVSPYLSQFLRAGAKNSMLLRFEAVTNIISGFGYAQAMNDYLLGENFLDIAAIWALATNDLGQNN